MKLPVIAISANFFRRVCCANGYTGRIYIRMSIKIQIIAKESAEAPLELLFSGFPDDFPYRYVRAEYTYNQLFRHGTIVRYALDLGENYRKIADQCPIYSCSPGGANFKEASLFASYFKDQFCASEKLIKASVLESFDDTFRVSDLCYSIKKRKPYNEIITHFGKHPKHYSNPWIGVVNQGKFEFHSFWNGAIGYYTGRFGKGDEGDLIVKKPEIGCVYVYGIKNYETNTSEKHFALWDGIKFVACDRNGKEEKNE